MSETTGMTGDSAQSTSGHELPTSRPKRKGRIILSLIVVLALAVGVSAWWFLVERDNKAAAPEVLCEETLNGVIGLDTNMWVAQEMFEELEKATINYDLEVFKSEISPTLVRGAWVLGQMDFLMGCNVWSEEESKEISDTRSDLANALHTVIEQCTILLYPEDDLCDINLEQQAILKTCGSWLAFDLEPGMDPDLVEIRERGIDAHIADRAFAEAQKSWDNHKGFFERAPQILQEIRSDGFCHSYDPTWEQNGLDNTIRDAEELRDLKISRCEREWSQWIDC